MKKFSIRTLPRSVMGPFLFGLILTMGGCHSSKEQLELRPGGLQAGDQAFDFSLLDSSGRLVSLAQAAKNWYLVMVFYRGQWCDSCREQLNNLKEDTPKFTALHTALVAISTDSREDSAEYDQQWRFPFPLLSDPNLKVIDAYGIRHVGGHGIHDIARPTLVLVDPKRRIRYKYVGKNPVDRPTDNEILFIIQQIQAKDGYRPG